MNKFLYVLFALCISILFTEAQPGALDLSFDPGSGANDRIRATAIQTDGKIVIGGDFISFNGSSLSAIARLNSDGSVDTSFHIGTGANGRVNALVIQTDGKIIIGGEFASYNGAIVNYVARLNTDGSRDTTFNTGTGADDYIKAICIQSDGKIIIGGRFTNFNGIARSRLVRLNTDGSIDAVFNTATGANGTVESMAIQTDGKIVIGGSFTIYGINPCLRLARVNPDGSGDTGFNTFLGGASSTVIAIAIQNDGLIIIGGNFTNYNAVPTNRFTRINTNGSLDNTFFPGQSANSTVNAIQVLNNGDILLAGGFTTYNGIPVNRFARLNSAGMLDLAFNTGTGSDRDIHSISVQTDGKLIIGGALITYSDTSRSGVARIYNCSALQPGTISGSDSTICSGIVETYSINPVADAESYSWSLPSGWSGSSDSTSITTISNGMGGVISVRAFSDSCGYSLPQTKTIYRIEPPGTDICLVTVDTASTHNIIIWDKPQTNLIDSFFIYREVATGVYSKIASVPYDSLSEYHDTAANPNTTSYRYKLAVLDTCGAESTQSLFHNTIHLQNFGSGNFQWTFYQIESSLNPVITFNVYRDNLGNGNFSQIGFVPGTNSTFTDLTYASFPNAVYVIDANWSISCIATRAVSTTRSNIRKLIDTVAVAGMPSELMDYIEIYPNPAEEVINMSYPTTVSIIQVKLFNPLGQIIWSESPYKRIDQINVEALPKGVYTLGIKTNLGYLMRRVILQ